MNHSTTDNNTETNPDYCYTNYPESQSPTFFSHPEYIQDEAEYQKRLFPTLESCPNEVRIMVAGLSKSGKTTFLENLRAVINGTHYSKAYSSANILAHGTQQITQFTIDFHGKKMICTDFKGFEGIPGNVDYASPEEIAEVLQAAFLGIFSAGISKILPTYGAYNKGFQESPQHLCILFLPCDYQTHEILFISKLSTCLIQRDVKFIIVATKYGKIDADQGPAVLRRISNRTGKDIDHVLPCESCLENYSNPSKYTKCFINKIMLDIATIVSRANSDFELKWREKLLLRKRLSVNSYYRMGKAHLSQIELVLQKLTIVVLLAVIAIILLK